MKRILFVTPYNPAGRNTGDKVYTWDILRALRYNDSNYVHVVMYGNNDSPEVKDTLKHLVNEVTYVPFRHKNKVRMLCSRYPLSVANRKTVQMENTVSDILHSGKYDVIMINMLKLTYLIDSLTISPIKKIYISHNVEYEVSRIIYKHSSNILLKFIYWLDYYKTLWFEKKYTPKFDVVTSICDKDAAVYSENKWGRPYVLKPIVDVNNEAFRPSESRKIILCGSFTWMPKKINLNSLLSSPNILLLNKTNCILEIVGRADIEEIDKGNNIPNVVVTGAVESVHDYYKNATVAIVPEKFGGGFKLKIAEAVQHHVPIVALKESITDFNMRPDIHYIRAQDFDDLISKAICLVNDVPKQAFLVKNAASLFQKTYSIEAINRVLNEILH